MNVEKVDLQKYSTLIKKLDAALEGEEVDDVMPALISFTVMAACFARLNKRMVLAYFADSLDKTYGDFDAKKSNTPRRNRNGAQ
jgi:hypothetical protein